MAQPLDRALRSVQGLDGGTDGTGAVPVPDLIPHALRKEQVRVSYELDISSCANTPAAALWLFRVGAPYRISAGGQPLAVLNARALLNPALLLGSPALALTDVHNGRVPALFALPSGATRVTVELLTPAYFPTGIARGLLGPTHVLLAVQAQAAEATIAYVDTASVVLMVASLMTLMLWLSRRGNRALLWLAIACGLWGMRGLTYFGHKVYPCTNGV